MTDDYEFLPKINKKDLSKAIKEKEIEEREKIIYEKEMEYIYKIIKQIRIVNDYIENNKNNILIDDKTSTIVLNESVIFGTNNSMIAGTETMIDGKKITIKIQKDERE
jgi:hypothetical protein